MPDYDPSKNYLISGATLADLDRRINEGRPIAGAGLLSAVESGRGTVLSLEPSRAGRMPWEIYVVDDVIYVWPGNLVIAAETGGGYDEYQIYSATTFDSVLLTADEPTGAALDTTDSAENTVWLVLDWVIATEADGRHMELAGARIEVGADKPEDGPCETAVRLGQVTVADGVPAITEEWRRRGPAPWNDWWGSQFVVRPGEVDCGDSAASSSEQQSSKSTAIVPAPWLGKDGYVALFIAEMPEVRFDDVQVVTLTGRVTVAPMDTRFVAVCEPGSIVCCGWSADRPGGIGVRIDGGQIRIEAGCWRRPRRVVARLSGIRRGFRGLRLPSRTREQFEANERFIRSAYNA